MENVRKPLTFTVKQNQYSIKTPTAGQLWDVEELKAVLSNGNYGNVLRNRTFWSEYSLDTIDMFAYLSIMCPDLIKDLNVTSWKQLDPFDLAELKAAYRAQFIPWFSKFTEMLKSVDQKQDESDESVESK